MCLWCNVVHICQLDFRGGSAGTVFVFDMPLTICLVGQRFRTLPSKRSDVSRLLLRMEGCSKGARSFGGVQAGVRLCRGLLAAIQSTHLGVRALDRTLFAMSFIWPTLGGVTQQKLQHHGLERGTVRLGDSGSAALGCWEEACFRSQIQERLS